MTKHTPQHAPKTPRAAHAVPGEPSAKFTRSSADRYVEQARRRSRKRRIIWGSVLGVILVLFAAGGVVLALWYQNIQSRLNNSQVITSDLRNVLSEPTKPSDPYWVLLMGTDGRPGETAYRADSIILTRVDPVNKKIAMLSIPRDTKFEWKGTTMKINGVHTYEGAAGMVEAIEKLTGVQISHYAEINFDGLEALTNALGGVTIDVDQDMTDEDNFVEVTHLDAGVQKLNGAQALFYTRVRHAFADGDFTRMRHQRTFITAVVKQVLETRDPATLVNVINATADMVATDLSIDQILALANEMRGLDTETDMYSIQPPGDSAMINGASYILLDEDRFKQIIDEMSQGLNPNEDNSATTGSSTSSTSSSTSTGTAATSSSTVTTSSSSTTKSSGVTQNLKTSNSAATSKTSN